MPYAPGPRPEGEFTQESRVTPDGLFYQYFDPVMPFIIGDFNNDGQYEIVRGDEDQTHRDIEETLITYKMTQNLNSSRLPLVQGRTGKDAYGLIVAFWKAGRSTLKLEPLTDGQEDDPEYFNQWIEQQILPLLLKEKIITPDTIWFDSQARYRGTVVDTQQTKGQEKFYDVGGRSMTYMDVMTALHAGDATARQQVTNFICQSTDRVFDQVRSRLMCGRQKPQQPMQPRRVEIGPHHPRGVDFRSQKSLNRAWEEEMSRRISRRLRLARLLVFPVQPS